MKYILTLIFSLVTAFAVADNKFDATKYTDIAEFCVDLDVALNQTGFQIEDRGSMKLYRTAMMKLLNDNIYTTDQEITDAIKAEIRSKALEQMKNYIAGMPLHTLQYYIASKEAEQTTATVYRLKKESDNMHIIYAVRQSMNEADLAIDMNKQEFELGNVVKGK